MRKKAATSRRGLTRLALASSLPASVSTIDRLIADGLRPVGRRGRALLYDRAEARRLLAHRRPTKTSKAELAQALRERAADVRAELVGLVAAHVPAGVVARQAEALHATAAEALGPWPATTTPSIAARLRGENRSIPDDPRLTNSSRVLLHQAPRSAVAVALAVTAEARAILERLADAPLRMPAGTDRLDTEARAPWLEEPDVSSPRALLATWSLRRARFRREIRRGAWVPIAAVEAGLVSAITIARQGLLHDAPAAVVKLLPEGSETEIQSALDRAVQATLVTLRADTTTRRADP